MTTFSDTRALVILEAQYALVRPSQPERSEAYVPEALVDFFAGERCASHISGRPARPCASSS